MYWQSWRISIYKYKSFQIYIADTHRKKWEVEIKERRWGRKSLNWMRRGKRLLLRRVRSPTARFKGHGQWRQTASFPRGVPERQTTSSVGGDPFLSIQGLQFGKRRRRPAEETRRVERHEEHIGNHASLSPRPLVDQPLGTNFGGVCSCTGSPARAVVRLPGQRSPSMCLGRWGTRA